MKHEPVPLRVYRMGVVWKFSKSDDQWFEIIESTTGAILFRTNDHHSWDHLISHRIYMTRENIARAEEIIRLLPVGFFPWLPQD